MDSLFFLHSMFSEKNRFKNYFNNLKYYPLTFHPLHPFQPSNNKNNHFHMLLERFVLINSRRPKGDGKFPFQHAQCLEIAVKIDLVDSTQDIFVLFLIVFCSGRLLLGQFVIGKISKVHYLDTFDPKCVINRGFK